MLLEAQVTHLSAALIGQATVVLLAPFSLLCALLALWLAEGKAGLAAWWLPAVGLTALLATGQWFCCRLVSVELAGLAACVLPGLSTALPVPAAVPVPVPVPGPASAPASAPAPAPQA